jgi:glycosyltransferase involved in cell wall biosynthesis
MYDLANVHRFPTPVDGATGRPFRMASNLPAQLTVVVPCYNESKRLDFAAFSRFLRARRDIRMVLVNDGSTDDTTAILSRIAVEHSEQVSVLDLFRNVGKAEAVRIGLLAALRDGASLVAYWDADLATPLELVDDFSAVAGRHSDIEVVFGSRRSMLGHRVRRTPGRRLVSRLCATLARLAIGLPVSDTQCGAKLLRSTPAVRAALATPFTAGWLFDVELMARIRRGTSCNERAFYELPLSEWTEVAGSKVTGRAIIKSGFRMLRLIAELRLASGASDLATPQPVPAEFAVSSTKIVA